MTFFYYKSLFIVELMENIMALKKEYATIQISRQLKEQIVDHCDKNDLKIGRFMEKLFMNYMSGSYGL